MPTIDGEQIIIRSEDDAWRYLEEALDGAFGDGPPPEIEFDGWPRFQIRLSTPDATITPSIMEGFIDLQSAIYRTHVLLLRGSRSLTTLTADERLGLEFVVKVEAGSSLFDIDGEKVVEQILNTLAGEMEPEHWVITILGVALLWFGRTAWKDFLDSRVKTRTEEVRSDQQRELIEGLTFLSKQETERIKVLARAIGESEQLPTIDEEVDEARKSILKSVPEGVSADIGGAELNGEQAKELMKNARRRSEPISIEGTFAILRVDTTAPDGFRVRLREIENETVVTAGVQHVLISDRQRRVIREAEWAKAPIKARIDAKLRRGVFVDAVIKEVSRIEEGENPD